MFAFRVGQASQADVDRATAMLARASAAAQAAEENYHETQLDAAALNPRRRRQLRALGSARESDIARAEEKLAQLQQRKPSVASILGPDPSRML